MTPDPSILCHPNIPKPLHGVNPRTVYGRTWWDNERHKAYEVAGFCCQACGVPRREALYRQWLEAHEFYVIDYAKGLVTFDHLVALCHACHNFIHDGRLAMLLDEGKISADRYQDILHHGRMLLKGAGLTEQHSLRHDPGCRIANWKRWRMVIDGKKYGPSTKSYDEWLAGKWRNWKPIAKGCTP